MIPFTDFQIERYMNRAIQLALQHPHRLDLPYVGALVVSPDGKILGEGYRTLLSGTFLTLHAERVALDACPDDRVFGSYLVTTLEPCLPLRDSFGRKKRGNVFSSCSELIVERRIAGVVVGYLDPCSSTEAGNGISYLRSRGVAVDFCHKFQRIIKSRLM